MSKRQYIRLPLKNAYNTRDLGGYACLDGRITKWNTLLRSDDPTALDKEEVDFLVNYGVACVIDLRSREECEIYPNPFERDDRVEYANIPLMTNVITDVGEGRYEQSELLLSDLYIDMIRNAQVAIREVFEKIASVDGGVLFHCAAGKDRTGVIAMLLLGLVGVSMPDIVSNYEITYTYLMQNPIFRSSSCPYPVEVMMSKAEYIENLIQYILNTYGTIAQYLESIGISDRIAARIRNKICE